MPCTWEFFFLTQTTSDVQKKSHLSMFMRMRVVMWSHAWYQIHMITCSFIFWIQCSIQPSPSFHPPLYLHCPIPVLWKVAWTHVWTCHAIPHVQGAGQASCFWIGFGPWVQMGVRATADQWVWGWKWARSGRGSEVSLLRNSANTSIIPGRGSKEERMRIPLQAELYIPVDY
jgi:hypothetical protein